MPTKKGQLAVPPEWWKHLRWTKRTFWKAERQVGKQEAEREEVETQVYGRQNSTSASPTKL